MSYKGKERASDEDEMEEGEQQDNHLSRSRSKSESAVGEGHVEPQSIYNEDLEPQPVWLPKHVLDRPKPPTREEREAELALLEAQARAGQGTNDPRAKSRVKPRRTVDYFGPMSRWKLIRGTARCLGEVPILRPQPNYVIDLLPPAAYTSNVTMNYCNKYAHTSTNKVRTAVNVVRWTPEGRRLLTGAASGEFTLWNGLTFNFETILQAHDHPIRAAEWSHSGAWLVSCDNGGVIKYFQPNMNNVTLFNGHSEPIRDISFAPDDQRFCTGSDDGSVKIWDFERREMEKSLTGHGYDVRCVKWHPTKSLLVSGSKNNLIKFWDPRTGSDLRTLHDHKNSVQAVSWSPNGNMVASASRDQSVRVFDIRMMKEVQDFRGHAKDVCSVTFHPIHNNYLVSAGSDGSILHWHLDNAAPVDTIEFGHEGQIWAMDFHPLGHLLATGSSDHTTRWWARGRPGVGVMNDRFHVGRDKAKELGGKEDDDDNDDDEFAGALPGLHHGGGYNNRYSGPQQNQYNNANNSHFSSSNAHMPAFTMPSGPPTNSGGLSIPGLESAPRQTASGGIPGLAAAQAAQNQNVASAYGRVGGQSLPPQQAARGGYSNTYRGGGQAGRGRGSARGGYNNQGGGDRFKPY